MKYTALLFITLVIIATFMFGCINSSVSFSNRSVTTHSSQMADDHGTLEGRAKSGEGTVNAEKSTDISDALKYQPAE